MSCPMTSHIGRRARHDQINPARTERERVMERCETCKFWERGSTYRIAPYGHQPERVAWTAAATGKYQIQEGECRIVAPYRCGGNFPITYEFQGCGEHQPEPHP